MGPIPRRYESHLYHLNGACEGLTLESHAKEKYTCKHRLKIHSSSMLPNDLYDLTDKSIPISLFEINELAIMVLEYCADSECAKAAPFNARRTWYYRLNEFYLNTTEIQQVNSAINCYSGALNPEVFCRETAWKIKKFVQTAHLMTQELSNLSDLDILPLIPKIIKVMNIDLCNVFELVRVPVGFNLDTSNMGVCEKANNIRKWIMEPENQEKLKVVSKIRFEGFTAFTIPPEISYFSSLTTFFATYSNIQSIPIQFFSLSLLNIIFLSHNLLTEIPPQIGNLKKLIRLELGRNYLEQLPNEILELPLLERLTLNYNPWICFPKEMSSKIFWDIEMEYKGRIDYTGKDRGCGFKTDILHEHLTILDGTSEKKCTIS